jgi:hypothetical protein
LDSRSGPLSKNDDIFILQSKDWPLGHPKVEKSKDRDAVPGQTVQFTATLDYGGGVVWSVVPSAAGSIDAQGRLEELDRPGGLRALDAISPSRNPS